MKVKQSTLVLHIKGQGAETILWQETSLPDI
jgi:hypothetical protein